jgi:hypothetical protein
MSYHILNQFDEELIAEIRQEQDRRMLDQSFRTESSSILDEEQTIAFEHDLLIVAAAIVLFLAAAFFVYSSSF